MPSAGTQTANPQNNFIHQLATPGHSPHSAGKWREEHRHATRAHVHTHTHTHTHISRVIHAIVPTYTHTSLNSPSPLLLHLLNSPFSPLPFTPNTQKIPEEAEYRKVITSIATYRLQKAEAITDPAKLEEELDDGQLEEIIQQGEDELSLIDDYAEWKYWETEEVKAAFKD